MSIPGELLAKSPRGLKRLTLEQHLIDTEQAAIRIFDLQHRWGAGGDRAAAAVILAVMP
jgi:hypothetical protein